MPALRRWKPNLALREKPMTLRLLPKQLLISHKNRHWLRRRKRRKPWLMLRKNIVCESTPWLSGFRRCLLLLKVHTFAFPLLRLLVCFLVLSLKLSFPAFPVSFVIQDSPGYLCRLYIPAMIL
jgi:hypothetical protein